MDAGQLVARDDGENGRVLVQIRGIVRRKGISLCAHWNPKASFPPDLDESLIDGCCGRRVDLSLNTSSRSARASPTAVPAQVDVSEGFERRADSLQQRAESLRV